MNSTPTQITGTENSAIRTNPLATSKILPRCFAA